MKHLTSNIEYVPVESIFPHTQNPRKNLGDLTELADSIKQNGIMQNLTVVPGHTLTDDEWKKLTALYKKSPSEEIRQMMNSRYSDEGYTVVIGHRRLAAAKLAGLKTVPCVVTDMDEKEQLRTMMMENMQRSDLTVYEQAQGFQLMLDMGDTIESVAKDTGFSTTTVRHRVKLLELDKDKFKKSEARGATISDYLELEKLESPDAKNALLDAIGTADFRNKLTKALENQEQQKIIAVFAEAASAFAEKVDTPDDSKMRRVTGYAYYHKDVVVEKPEDADTVHYFYTVSQYMVTIYKERVEAESEADAAAQAERERKEEIRKRQKEDLKEATARAYKLRMEFVKGVSSQTAKKHLGDIAAFIIWCTVNDFVGISSESMEELFGSNFDFENECFTLENAAAMVQSSERALLLIAYAISNDDDMEGYANLWRLSHKENEELDALYSLLGKLGYEMSSEEKALQDGSHELFQTTESESDNG